MIHKKLGLAGCGRMGGPMLAALHEAGFDAHGLDVRPLGDFDGIVAPITNDPIEFAAGLEVLITVVRDIDQTEDVLFGAQNLVSKAPDLKWIILSSTLSPRYVKALRDRIPPHIRLVDAPMSGAQVAAREKRLSFMLGGAPGDLDHLQPLFATMGRHFHRMGAYGAGMSAKVLNNLLAASATAMTRLVLDWGDRAGLNEADLLALFQTSSGQNWFASGFDDIEFSRDGIEADNTIAILVKDVASALDAAPGGADTILPEAIQRSLSKLDPRS